MKFSECFTDYDIQREGDHLVAYLNGEPVVRSQNYTELSRDLAEYEKERPTPPEGAKKTYRVDWIIEANNRSGYISDYEKVVAYNEQEAKAIIQKRFPAARQLKAVEIETLQSSFAEHFELYENLRD